MSKFCPTCEDFRDTRVEDRQETYTVRGRTITVPVTVEICASCGESMASDEQDQQVLDAVHAEYRRQMDLLHPDQIKQIRRTYRLSQKSFAALLGMSEATLNRYEKGGLQEQVHDNAIRACENPQFIRNILERRGHFLTDWQRTRVEKVLAGEAESDTGSIDLVGDTDWMRLAREVSDTTGFRRFEYKRYASVVVWLCKSLGEVSRTVINKLLFYVDFLHFKTATVSLTGTAYRRLQYGPVPSDYGLLLDRMEAEELLTCREQEYQNDSTGFYYQAGSEAGSLDTEFTRHEMRVLEHVANTFRDCTARVISERSHQESAWRDTEDRQLISYQKAATLSLDLPEEASS